MKKVFLIQGFEGSPNGGWRPYIMYELEKIGIYACSLPMPSPEAPILEEWLDTIKNVIERDLEDEVYLVGHSLGGTVILRYLERFNTSNIKGVILASAPCNLNKNDKIAGFLNTGFNWDAIKNYKNSAVVIHGSNDPYVPISDAEEIKNKLNAELIIIQDGKHLNGSAGYLELPEALNALIKMFKN